jgi:hypothetical protein
LNKRIVVLASLAVLLCIAIIGMMVAQRLRNTTQAIQAIEASKTYEASISQAAAAQTLAAMPTITPSPTVTPTIAPYVSCDAVVQGTNRYLYPVPSFGYNRALTELIPPNTVIQVIGKLPNFGWVKVHFHGSEGWMRSAYIAYVESSCNPNTYPLSFLLGNMPVGNRVIVDDTFANNANSWTDSSGVTLSATIQSGDAYLEVNASGLEHVTTDALKLNNNWTAFDLNTSISYRFADKNSYFGFRFRDTGLNYYQVTIAPYSCSVSVYRTEDLLYQATLNPIVCSDKYYSIELSLDSSYSLALRINGYDPITLTLQDPNGLYVNGGIQFVANAVDLNWNYIVITVP